MIHYGIMVLIYFHRTPKDLYMTESFHFFQIPPLNVNVFI